jgi:hypothetical protein
MLMNQLERDVIASTETRDPLYLFTCHIEWRNRMSLAAYKELIAALDDGNEDVRFIAEHLLHRSSPRPHTGESTTASSEVFR